MKTVDILKSLERLSKLSRETSGASFTIQHEKSSGKFKVVFANCLNRSKRDLQPTDFIEAIDNAIGWLERERTSLDIEYKFKLN